MSEDIKIAKDSIDDSTVEGVRSLEADKYKYGFDSDIEQEFAPKGLNEDIVRFISEKKDEPQWLLDWRLEAYRRWLTLEEPEWAMVDYPKIDFQDMYYYASPVKKKELNSLDEVDPEILEVYNKLGISLKEQEVLAGVKGAPKVAVDAVFDSVSVVTTFKKELAKHGVIFCSFSEAVKDHPELVKKYMGSVVPVTDNYYATLNNAVFSDGSFVYIPPGVRCPMELSTYFRMNAQGTGQFERTLIIADKGSYVSYLEGCTAPTWKYPSCILRGDNSQGEFYSIAITNGHQQADTGTKMIHLGKNTKSRVISKGISAGKSNSTYRGLVSAHKKATGARNFTQCDSLLIGDLCGAHTVPYIESNTPTAQFEHEATTSKLSDDQLFYCRQRGLSEEDAVALLVNGCRWNLPSKRKSSWRSLWKGVLGNAYAFGLLLHGGYLALSRMRNFGCKTAEREACHSGKGEAELCFGLSVSGLQS